MHIPSASTATQIPAASAQLQPSDTPVSAVLLDLDGTITDSAPVILQALKHTLQDLKLPIGTHKQLMTYIGPPLTEGFRVNANLTGTQNKYAVALYRKYYKKYMCEAPLYKGIIDLLHKLQDWKIPVSLATSKREEYAISILQHHNLLPLFTAFAGADPADQHGEKEAVVRLAIQRLRDAGAQVTHAVHVGDRIYDVSGAHNAGIECIGALWGYGSRQELAQAQWLAETPTELIAMLRQLTGNANN